MDLGFSKAELESMMSRLVAAANGDKIQSSASAANTGATNTGNNQACKDTRRAVRQ